MVDLEMRLKQDIRQNWQIDDITIALIRGAKQESHLIKSHRQIYKWVKDLEDY